MSDKDRVAIVATADKVTYNVEVLVEDDEPYVWRGYIAPTGFYHMTNSKGEDLFQFKQVTVSRADANADALFVPGMGGWIIWPRKESADENL